MTKISQIDDRGAVVAWCPIKIIDGVQMDLIALGSKDSGGVGFDDYGGELELYDCSIAGTQKPVLLGKVKTSSRFASIDWSPSGPFERGMIVGGMSDGTVQLWNAAGVINGDDIEARTIVKHSAGGAVTALAFNMHDWNMLASGSSGGQLLITSLEDVANPNTFTPSENDSLAVSSSAEITRIAWNTQVTHIVASASGNGTVVVWDLKQRKPWCELRCESVGGVSDIAWHPTEGLQLITASAEDPNNVMKLWDLRTSTTMALATLSAVEVSSLSGGIFSCDWCPHDPALLISCGKDNRTLVWDLYAMAPIFEVPNENDDRDPQINSFSGSEQKLGASFQEKRYSAKWSPHRRGVISTCSFDRKVQLHSLIGFPNQGSKSNRTPKWLRGNTGVSFGFGGKLVCFGGEKNMALSIKSVVENPVLVSLSKKFEKGIVSGDYKNYCQQKTEEADNSYESQVWGFMQIIFETNARQLLLQYLGFNPNDIQEAVSNYQAQPSAASKRESNISEDATDLITQALLVGNFEAAVDCCFKSGNTADALILASCGGAELWAKAQTEFFAQATAKRPYLSVVKAIINSQLDELVQVSDLKKWRETLAILSTYGKSEEFASLCSNLGKRLEQEGGDLESASLCFMCSVNINDCSKYWRVLVENQTMENGDIDMISLHQFVEKVCVFCETGTAAHLPNEVSQLFGIYANELASQGQFSSALRYCRGDAGSCKELMSRLYYGGGSYCQKILSSSPPQFPFEVINVGRSKDVQHIDPKQEQQKKRQPVRASSNSIKNTGNLKRENPLPHGWHELRDPNSGKAYYYNEKSGETTWDRPVPSKKSSSSHQSNGYTNGHFQQSTVGKSNNRDNVSNQSYSQHGKQSSQNPYQQVNQHSVYQTQSVTHSSSATSNTVASKYGDGFVSSASHPELAQQYGNVGTSNPYTGNSRPGTAVVSPMRKKNSPVSANLNLDEIQLSPEVKALSDSFFGIANKLEESNLSPTEKKQLAEARKCLNILVKKIGRGMVSAEIIVTISNMSSALSSKNFSLANSCQTSLVNSDWKNHKDWLRGTKLLIQLASKKAI